MHGLEDRCRGALAGVGAGDAIGAPFEGRWSVEPAAVAAWIEAGEPLRWTDDTALTIALAESLLDNDGFDGPAVASRFVAAYEAEPWRGYGAGPPRVFAALRAGAPWDAPAREQFGGAGSFGNGGAMRAVPAGLHAIANPEEAARVGAAQARVTHAHPRGEQGAALLAAAVAVVVAGPVDAAGLVAAVEGAAPDPAFTRRLARLPTLVDARPGEVAHVLGNGIAADEAVPAALQSFCAHPTDFLAAVSHAVQLGGDTDTIAAMTGGLVGARVGLSEIPPRIVDRLEAGERLAALGARFAERASAADEGGA